MLIRVKRSWGQETGKVDSRKGQHSKYKNVSLKAFSVPLWEKKNSSTVYSYSHRIRWELEMPLTVTRVPPWVAKTCSDSRRMLRSNRARSVTAPPAALFQVFTLDRAAGNLLNEPSPQALHGALRFFYQTSKFPFSSSNPLYSIYSSKTLCKLRNHWANVHTQNMNT